MLSPQWFSYVLRNPGLSQDLVSRRTGLDRHDIDGSAKS